MLHSIIEYHKNQWLKSDDCSIKNILEYIIKKGKLRESQLMALETYLFLKIKGENKPLWQLFSEGFFIYQKEDLSKLHISQNLRDTLNGNIAALALFDFVRFAKLKEIENFIIANHGMIEYVNIIKNLFYKINYTDYLFSLPMGAGKTFLMAAIIYLDLYFAINEPENKIFAHNFLILIPSGLKSSIIPSLKTIDNFDPTWILPNPTADKLKNIIKFEILNAAKSTKKTTSTIRSNSQKVNDCLSDPFGKIMVVNAEKVILDRINLTNQGEAFERNQDEKDKFANELRNLIGKIPNLQILIDEVHHAATDDIKLRKVVSKWNELGNISGVLGFSGTPYLSQKEEISFNENVKIKFSQITSTVFYYPLTTAIKKFLKKPRVEQVSGLNSLQIIKKGVDDFIKNYNDKIYNNGTIAKLAIYCGSIENLEERIYPFLVGEMKIEPSIILKYHKGNKKYKLPKVNEIEFASLDTPISKIKIILLVQVGKEGWDCRSLTSVILSQKGDCPTNMVLQTSCRCLRQVDENKLETALIWLNEENEAILDRQLNEEHNTSIKDLNNLDFTKKENFIQRYSRLDYLKLPKIDFYQLKVEYKTLIIEEVINSKNKIESINVDKMKIVALLKERGFTIDSEIKKEIIREFKGNEIKFRDWLFSIYKESFNTINLANLESYKMELENIFNKITIEQNNKFYFNELFNHTQIKSDIRLAFHQKRDFETNTDLIPDDAQLLLIEKLRDIPENNLQYPNKTDVKKILDFDISNKEVIEKTTIELSEEYKNIIDHMVKGGFDPSIITYSYDDFINNNQVSPALRNKNRSFHYLPYNFWQSNFELEFLKQSLTLNEMKHFGLEIYYNGERELTDFRICCYAKNGKFYQKIGLYTPDFLIIQRKENQIHKVLIVETKGSGFGEQTAFLQRKNFIESEFLKMNNDKFNYKKFDFLYLEDRNKMENNLSILSNAITEFFGE